MLIPDIHYIHAWMSSSSVVDCASLALAQCCWLRYSTAQHERPSETDQIQSLLDTNGALTGTKRLWFRTGLIVRAEGRGEGLWELRCELQGKRWRKADSVFFPLSFRWWHGILLTQQCLWTAMPRCLGDLLPMIHPKLPQIIGTPWLWNHI